MKPDQACKICLDKGIKVYPVVSGNYFQIEYSVNDKPRKRYDKVLRKRKDVNEAMVKTYIYLAKKIKGIS